MTTVRRWNPPGIAAPASRYSHAVLAEAAEQWLHLTGQVGMRPDGTVAERLGPQLAQCLANVDAGLRAAGMARSEVVKLTFCLTIGTPEAIATCRAARDAWTGDAGPPAATLLIVAGLASSVLLVEVDCVAARQMDAADPPPPHRGCRQDARRFRPGRHTRCCGAVPGGRTGGLAARSRDARRLGRLAGRTPHAGGRKLTG